MRLQDIPALFLVVDDGSDFASNEFTRNYYASVGDICRSVEENILEQRREHGMEPPRADILHLLVDIGRHASDLANAIIREFQLDPFGGEKCTVLLDERVLRDRQDLGKILGRQ